MGSIKVSYAARILAEIAEEKNAAKWIGKHRRK